MRLNKCELKMLADVGLIGLPSVGKSTLISMISNCKPKIAAYHFTTLSPNLGVVKAQNGQSFVMADLPGLIEGASEGAGLGDKFLKHAMRSKILCHVLDMSGIEGRKPWDDYEIIRKELVNYSDKLAHKEEVIVASKMDMPDSLQNLEEFKKKYKKQIIFPISAIKNEGLEELITYLIKKLTELENNSLYDNSELESHMIFKFKENKPYTITKENNMWVIKGKEIERLFAMTKFNEDEAILRFARKLKAMGIEEELEKMGAKRGDEVQICDFIFEFKE